MQLFPKLPLADWIDQIVDVLTENLGPLFDLITEGIESFVDLFVLALTSIPALVLIAIFTGLAWWASRLSIALFTAIGMLLIHNLGYWDGTIETLALVLTSVLISIIIGVPIGIWMSQSDRSRDILTPILDFMQTMPAFVYLIPAILFFGIGVVPGIIASVIFAMPPTIRLTNLGIRQVPEDLIEAANAFGSTTKQKLFKVQLPLATPTIMAGINQSIMLALSMVVIASLVGAPGLGADVYRAVTQIKVGIGFESGLVIVILAIVLDRISQNIGMKKQK
jgi:glycine betaine/proline transport system permease protein